MFVKIEDKNCKVLVDSESGINAISFKVTEKLGLEVVPYPHPYKVSRINSTALEVNQRYFILVNFNLYKNKIWSDVVTMGVG